MKNHQDLLCEMRCRLFYLPIVLLLVFLVPLEVFGDRIVQGRVGGTWSAEDRVIRVIGNVEVPADSELTIEAGVHVLFEGDFRLTIRGRINAVGADSVDLRISFGRPDLSRWWGIYFEPGSHIRSALAYCDIINPWIGVNCVESSPRLENNSINSQSIGINCVGSAPEINGNDIAVTGASTSNNPTGIWLTYNSHAFIRDNRIDINTASRGEVVGINITSSQPVITDNWINIRSDGIAIGVFADGLTKLDLIRNIIRVSSPIDVVGVRFNNSTGVTLLNNDIHILLSSSYARAIHINRGSEVAIINNIVVGNGTSIGVYSQGNSVAEGSGYNDFWLNSMPYEGGWEGSESDIAEDPLFAGASEESTEKDDYQLVWENDDQKSPCIDTGSPDLRDLDGTRSDMGALYFPQQPVVRVIDSGEANPSAFRIDAAYPNPFNSSLAVRIEAFTTGNLTIGVYSPDGRELRRIWSGILQGGSHRFNWTPGSLAAGNYFLILDSESGQVVQKVVYLP